MSIYLNNVGEILRVYTQQVKSRDSRANGDVVGANGTVKDAVSFSMTLQQRQKLERLALEKMSDLTKKNGGQSGLGKKDQLDAGYNLFLQLNNE